MKMQDIEVRSLADESLTPPLTNLEEALIKSGVKILDSDDVETYKARKEHQVRSAMIDRKVRPHPVAIVLFAFVLAVNAVAILFGLHSPAMWSWSSSSLSFGLGGLYGSYRARRALLEHRIRLLNWRTYEVGGCGPGYPGGFNLWAEFRGVGLSEFTRIPVEAGLSAAALAGVGAHASFSVEQLDTDPFFWVTSVERPHERYCIFAWDEEGFFPQAQTNTKGGRDER